VVGKQCKLQLTGKNPVSNYTHTVVRRRRLLHRQR